MDKEKGSLLEWISVIRGHNFTLKISVLMVGSVGPCLRMTAHECKWSPQGLFVCTKYTFIHICCVYEVHMVYLYATYHACLWGCLSVQAIHAHTGTPKTTTHTPSRSPHNALNAISLLQHFIHKSWTMIMTKVLSTLRWMTRLRWPPKLCPCKISNGRFIVQGIKVYFSLNIIHHVFAI